MDHRVKVAGIAFWSLFFINLLIAVYVTLQLVLNIPLFGEIPMIFVALVNGVVCLVSAVSMNISEPYRL